jgi:hypothetical protein
LLSGVRTSLIYVGQSEYSAAKVSCRVQLYLDRINPLLPEKELLQQAGLKKQVRSPSVCGMIETVKGARA